LTLTLQPSQRKPLSLWLFSASSQASTNLDPLKTQIVRRNLAFLRAKQWLVHYNLYTGEIIQFCGNLPHTLPILLALFMIAAYPKDKIDSLGLSDPNLELVFQKQGFYGTAIPDIISWVADAIGVEPFHLGPFVPDANHTGAPPYRASFWPPYSTLNPWGSIMFAQMVQSMKNQLSIDFSTQVEILGPNGEPLFEDGYHEEFCYTQLCKAQQAIPCELNCDDSVPFIVSPYRESLRTSHVKTLP
jgi:hypothetical protein